MKTSERLLARLQAMGLEVPEDTRFVRTTASQRRGAANPWRWFAVTPDDQLAVPTWYTSSLGGIGSQWPMGELLTWPTLALVCWDANYGNISVLPWSGESGAPVVVEGQEPGSLTRSWWRPRTIAMTVREPIDLD
jgi:hypothetical protein